MDKRRIRCSLNKRAWVVQERLLARCVLHFGSHGLFFECREHEACETFPKGPPSVRHGNNSVNGFKKIYTIKNGFTNSFEKDVRSGYQRWNAVVQAFMDSELTNPSDKIISLSGIAEESQVHVIKEPCFAGFWKSTLRDQLAWKVPGERQASGRPSIRPSPYRAPSWSWLSIDAKVSLPEPRAPPENMAGKLIEILDIYIDLVDPNHTTGKIKGGHIVARSNPLIPAIHGRNTTSDVNVPRNYLLFAGEEIGTTVIFSTKRQQNRPKQTRYFAFLSVLTQILCESMGLFCCPQK